MAVVVLLKGGKGGLLVVVMVWVVVFLGGKGGLVSMFCLVVVVLVVVDVRCTHKSRYCTHTFTFTHTRM